MDSSDFFDTSDRERRFGLGYRKYPSDPFEFNGEVATSLTLCCFLSMLLILSESTERLVATVWICLPADVEFPIIDDLFSGFNFVDSNAFDFSPLSEESLTALLFCEDLLELERSIERDLVEFLNSLAFSDDRVAILEKLFLYLNSTRMIDEGKI